MNNKFGFAFLLGFLFTLSVFAQDKIGGAVYKHAGNHPLEPKD